MKKFEFKFSLVLKRRKDEERQALLLFSLKQKSYQNELSEKESLLKGLESSLYRREQLGKVPTSIFDFQTEQCFINGIKQRMIQADYRIMRAYRELEKYHLRYVEARKRTRMLELLEEKHHEQFKRDMNKKETKELEDLMIMRDRLKAGVA